MATEEKEVKKEGEDASTHIEIKKEGSDVSTEPDYKALYEKEKDRAENYKRAFKEKKELREAPESKEMNLDTIRQVIREETAGTKLDSMLKEKISDPNQRELARAYYENRIVKSGTSDEALSDDLDFAISAVKGVKAVKEAAELRRAIENKPSSSRTEGASSEKEIDKTNISPELKRTLEARAKAVGQDPQKFIEKFLENQKRTTVIS